MKVAIVCLTVFLIVQSFAMYGISIDENIKYSEDKSRLDNIFDSLISFLFIFFYIGTALLLVYTITYYNCSREYNQTHNIFEKREDL